MRRYDAPLAGHLKEEPLIEVVLVLLARDGVFLLCVVLVNEIEQDGGGFPNQGERVNTTTSPRSIKQASTRILN